MGPNTYTLRWRPIQVALDRRRPGQSALTTARAEADRVTILSGTECGRTLGTPVALLVPNEDHKPQECVGSSTGAQASVASVATRS
jgi:chorismate synthase